MNKKTTIIGSIMAATMFAAIAVGTTLALYTTEKRVNVHLQSGNFAASLYLNSLVRDELTDEGLWQPETNVDLSTWEGYDSTKQAVNLEVYTGKVFDGIKLVPGMEGTATFEIFNLGDVAFNYTVSIVNKEGPQEIMSQVHITSPAGTAQVVKGGSSTFEISYEYEDLGVDQQGVGLNNNSMNQEMSFDLLVVCTQVAKPSNNP